MLTHREKLVNRQNNLAENVLNTFCDSFRLDNDIIVTFNLVSVQLSVAESSNRKL